MHTACVSSSAAEALVPLQWQTRVPAWGLNASGTGLMPLGTGVDGGSGQPQQQQKCKNDASF